MDRPSRREISGCAVGARCSAVEYNSARQLCASVHYRFAQNFTDNTYPATHLVYTYTPVHYNADLYERGSQSPSISPPPPKPKCGRTRRVHKKKCTSVI